MIYTEQAKEVLKLSKGIAKEMQHPYIGTEHLLLALRKVFTGVAGQVLAMNHVEEERIIQVIDELVTPVSDQHSKKGEPVKNSPRLEFVLEESKIEAVRVRSDKIGTEHMLLALVHDTDCVAARILQTLNISLQRIAQDIWMVSGVDPREMAEETGADASGKRDAVLEQYGTDLTMRAEEGKLDPVIGREKEMERLMEILSRRTKNNPCLVGEPGVGKTAVIEGLAAQIATGIVPNTMQNKRIYTIDLAGMLAGTKYRGEFEERMKHLIAEVENAGNIILFLDEVHTIIGAGGAEGAMDASNILKPSLARGELQLIGATTISEYHKYIEKDAALERRFQPVTIEEPDEKKCIEILEGLKKRYEVHHQADIKEEALVAAVRLSERYISDRYLPDKAIDVLDEACAKARLRGFKTPTSIYELEQKLTNIKTELETAIRDGDMSLAKEINQEKQATEKKLEETQKRFQRNNARRKIAVTEDDIAEVVSDWTKVPVQKLQEAEGVKLQKLEATLHKRVVGQEEAVTAVAKAVRRGRVGLKDPNRPIGSFLFLGPTGVGKTELSKALAEAMFGSEEAMIRVDMSEYMEKQSVAKMIGSPPGYVGHEEGGQLSEQVRRHPYSVVLFDEIEKAHPDVFNVLLQVLDDGHITDSRGRKVDFRNTIIIMTSNAGAQAIIDPKKLGFNAREDAEDDYKRMKSNVMREIKLIFRPEFINRIDEVIVFHPLGKKEMRKIVGMMCHELVKRAKEQLGIKLTIRDSVKAHIAETGMDQKYGARPLRRAVQNQLEDPLAEAILSGEVKKDSEVAVGISKKEIKFIPKATK